MSSSLSASGVRDIGAAGPSSCTCCKVSSLRPHPARPHCTDRLPAHSTLYLATRRAVVIKKLQCQSRHPSTLPWPMGSRTYGQRPAIACASSHAHSPESIITSAAALNRKRGSAINRSRAAGSALASHDTNSEFCVAAAADRLSASFVGEVNEVNELNESSSPACNGTSGAAWGALHACLSVCLPASLARLTRKLAYAARAHSRRLPACQPASPLHLQAQVRCQGAPPKASVRRRLHKVCWQLDSLGRRNLLGLFAVTNQRSSDRVLNVDQTAAPRPQKNPVLLLTILGALQDGCSRRQVIGCFFPAAGGSTSNLEKNMWLA
jgi:hypothetical protein